LCSKLLILWVVVLYAPAVHASSQVLVLGDSLSAGYNIDVAQGWVQLLQQRLKDQGYGHSVVNASMSGETTGGGLNRLPRALALHSPQVVIVELGGNDGMRALPLSVIRSNLEKIVELSTGAGAQVVLVGIRIPPNYGQEYGEGFYRIYAELAQSKGLFLVPFALEGIALSEGMMQSDGIHPTASAQTRLLDNIWPALKKALDAKEHSKTAQ
jgi:acyl-CoA thioesterase-1